MRLRLCALIARLKAHKNALIIQVKCNGFLRDHFVLRSNVGTFTKSIKY